MNRTETPMFFLNQEVESKDLRKRMEEYFKETNLSEEQRKLVMNKVKKEISGLAARRMRDGQKTDKDYLRILVSHALGKAEAFVDQILADRERGETRLNPHLLTKGGAELTFGKLLAELKEQPINKETNKRRIMVLVNFDLDNFKPVNDKFGHLAGDEVLKSAGQAISQAIRGDDFGIHYSGDEFGLILNMEVPMDIDNKAVHLLVKENLKKVIERIQSLIKRPDNQAQQMSVGYSIIIPEMHGSYSDHFEDADLAGNTSKIFKGDLDASRQSTLERIIDAKEVRAILKRYPPEQIPLAVCEQEARRPFNNLLDSLRKAGKNVSRINVEQLIGQIIEQVKQNID